jgi:hypothetical protein
VLGIGATSLPYCAEFSGTNATVKADDEERFLALTAAAPATCPVP